MRDQLKFLNQSQPQTLVIAVLLSYFEAGWSLITTLLIGYSTLSLLLLALALVGAACGFGIANEKRMAYYGAIAVAALNLTLQVLFVLRGLFTFFNALLALMFAVALVVLLLHPMSRDHVKIWFR